jgi:hypothetical protein
MRNQPALYSDFYYLGPFIVLANHPLKVTSLQAAQLINPA